MAKIGDYVIPNYNPYNEFNDLQFFSFYDKYSRFNWETGKRETWEETIERTTNLLKYLSNNKLSDELYQQLFEKMYKMEIQPSMRLLATSFEQLKRDNISQYNCCYIVIDSIDAICESLYVGMMGVGMGYSVEKQFIKNLPIIHKIKSKKIIEYQIPDTTEGWVSSVRLLLEELFKGHDVKFDYSLIRPANKPLKIKGGYSSGYEILEYVHNGIRNIINGCTTEQLSSIEVHDLITTLADAGLSGGIRRSALLCLFDEDDSEMLACKSGNYYITNPNRMNSNNSVVLSQKYYSKNELDSLLNEMWISGTGDPGLFYRNNILNTLPERRKLSEYDKLSFGTNACQPEFATVLTPNGIRQFKDIEIGDIIWSGKQWTKIINKVYTGEKEVFEYITNSGKFIGTKDHKIIQFGERVEVKDATEIDIAKGQLQNSIIDWQDVIDGLVLGDGTVHKASNNKVLLIIDNKDFDYFNYEDLNKLIIESRFGIGKNYYDIITTINYNELPKTYERKIPDRFYYGTFNKICGFLKGLFSANGCVNGNGTRIELKQSSYILIKQVQEMLSAIGISSYITVNKEKTILFNNGEYICKESYNLVITKDRMEFVKLIGFLQNYKIEKININITNKNKLSYEINSNVSLGIHSVYEITVDCEEHTYWTSGHLVSNCSEIILRDCGVCNLSSAIIRKNDTLDIIEEKVKYATILGDIQSLGTYFPNLRNKWGKTAKEDRLLGVNILGYAENELLRNSDILQKLKQITIDTDKQFADIFNLNPSVAITSLKPSGNTSVLFNTTPGGNPYHFEYCYRNVTVVKGTTMYNYLYANGVPYQEYVGKPNAVMFKFPFKSPDNALLLSNTSAIQQLENWKQLKLNYTEHNPSVTITYKPEEIEDCKQWLFDNQNIICGIALFPAYDAKHPMLPIQEITKEEYEKAVSEFPELNWNNFWMYETHFDERQIVAECSGGRCDI